MKSLSILVALALAGAAQAADPASEVRGGITFHFPEEERDLVEPLIDDILQWWELTSARIGNTEAQMQEALSAKTSDEGAFTFFASDAAFGRPVPPELVEAFLATGATISHFPAAWARWLGGFDTVRIWSPAEAAAHYDVVTDTYTFDDLMFAGTTELSLEPRAFDSISKLADLPEPNDEIPAFRLDIPFAHPKSTSDEDALDHYRKIIVLLVRVHIPRPHID